MLPSEFRDWLTGAPHGLQKISGMSNLLSAKIKKIGADYGQVEVSYHIPTEFFNPEGFVHGGILSALVDECACLSAALASGPKHVGATQNLSISYLHPVRDPKLSVECSVIARNMKILSVLAKVLDADDRTCASGQASIFLTHGRRRAKK